MDLYTRIGMYFFTIGALLAILAGTFPLSETMRSAVLVLLIFFGVFSAILNVSEDEEINFLIAAPAFLLTVVAFKFLLGDHHLIVAVTGFFELITFFLGSMVLIVALKIAVEYASQGMGKNPLKHAEHINSRMERYLLSKKEHMWNFVVFVSVAFSFILVLLEVFFDLKGVASLFFFFDVLITVIFAMDLVVLFRKEDSAASFLRNCWLDIVATIPFFYILQSFSYLRIVKLARLVRIMRFIKLNKTLKFMSTKSGVKHYLHTPKN